MDSYELFGVEDGSGGMLDGLPELGHAAGFEPAVTERCARNVAPAYSQPAYSQETPLQKLSTFGGADLGRMDPNAQSVYAQGYGADRPMGPPPGSPYQHQRQMARPAGPGPQSAPQYPYQADNMYSMADVNVNVSGMAEPGNMQAAAAASGWGQHAAPAGYPAMHRYTQMNQYRQQALGVYPHQQEQKQQFPMMQQPGYQMQQQRHAAHYPQPNPGYAAAAAAAAAAGQGYAPYVHQRLPHHHQYHQLDAQQYGGGGHGHPAMAGAQQPVGYAQPHQPMQQPMQQQPMQQQQQQFAPKHSANLGSASPQYRAAFPQLSPQQMSPRPPQMSPRPPPPPQMSPAKANSSPSLTPKATAAPPPVYSQQSTLQALEQMVMPPSSAAPADYPAYQRNAAAQQMSMRNAMQEQQWPPPALPPARPMPGVNGPPMGSMGSMGSMEQRGQPPSGSAGANALQPTRMGYGSEVDVSALTEMAAKESDGRSDFVSAQSPTTSAPDKMPSSTTTTGSDAIAAGSDPATPTPTSTTDENATDAREASVPSGDSTKQPDEPSDASSTSQRQTPSQSTADAFADFNCVSSMSGYPGRPDAAKTKMDDLVQSNVSVFGEDNSISQESLADSNKSEPNSVHSQCGLRSPVAHNRAVSSLSNNGSAYNSNASPPSPTQSHSLSQTANVQAASPTAVQMQQQPQVPIVVAQQPPPSIANQMHAAMIPQVAAQNATNVVPGANQAQPMMGSLANNQSSIAQPVQAASMLNACNVLQQMANQNPTATNQPANPFDQTVQTMNPSGPGAGMGMGMTNVPMGPVLAPSQEPQAGGGYQAPIGHHQERAALQQQLQELYCMPAGGAEHQEKIARLQERLALLGQHEANEQCNGGAQCVLQTASFSSPMIDSPQVTSTTGRGRGKGSQKARKSRSKKGERPASPIQAMDALPVSEDFVTPGAGLSITSEELSDFTDVGLESILVESEKKKGRKSREPKKPKEPKPPKSPKEPKAPREKKRREKDAKEPRIKRKYVRKKKSGDSEESATDESFNKSLEENEECPASVADEAKAEGDEAEAADPGPDQRQDVATATDEAIDCPPEPESSDIQDKPEEMQADSQTPAEGCAVAETTRDEYSFEDQPSPEIAELPKRSKKARPPSKRVASAKSKGSRKSGGSSRKRRGREESDGEGEDLASTPPPSPPEDSESSTKRRSARNTQRKKYIDDVMLRFSDDDAPIAPSKSRKAAVPAVPQVAVPACSEGPTAGESCRDAKNQMNYVYVNTTEEDSMVVQHVLCSRMGKREKKKEEPAAQPPPPPSVEIKAPEEDEVAEIKTEKEEAKLEGDGDGDGEEEKDLLEKIEDKEEVEETVAVAEISEKVDVDVEEEVEPETKEEEDGERPLEMVEAEEFYVKYRNFSYLHCEWKTEEELYKGDKRIGNKIKRFKQKQAQQMNIFENLEDEPFNPDYTEADRVLDLSKHTDPATGQVVKHYLVKWRSLQYEDCTWELEEDVDPTKIEQYEKFSRLPPRDRWKPKKRPGPDGWHKLDRSPAYKGANSLREYQLEGLNWLLFSWYNGLNCILADEMGLGKTIQSLTFLHAVWEYGIRGPFLVIAPLSTIPNWQREIESWTDMNVIVYHGSAASRNMIQEYEMYFKNDKGQFVKDLTKFNILITTFEIIVTDFADLKGFNWRICVIDEAHRLKNRNCKLLEGLRQLNLEHRVLLSGTPLQNNVNELFSLLNFLEPVQFPSSDSFVQEFGGLKTEQEVQKLQCLLKPMMLRRLKEDVEKSLAPKEETVVEVELTNIQKKYYRGILERNFSFLSKGTTHANIPNLMNTMMELRKCCIHPYLLNGAEEQIQYDFKNQHGEDPDAYYKSLINSSGKMVLIDKLLPKLKANGHRVLIFSQMVKCLDILEDYLVYKKYPFERIDGRIRGNLRQAAIDKFSRPDSDRFVFLLCTKAGGLGINLTAADTVIIYDSDWNPQNDLQAQARCHRIGQQKMVKIYRLLCRNTYEREMFDKASLKLGLDKAILQSMNTSQGGKETNGKQLSKKEIEDLLKKGAYGALLDEDDGDKFCEEDIDVILARRTQVITMESEKGSTFSKASFASSANRSDIAIDDPDFWNKWARKAEIDTTEKDESEDLVISEPRRRTQIKRYGHDESAIDMSELESSSDSDPENEGAGGLGRSRRSKLKKKKYRDEYFPREGAERGDIVYGSWARRECFMVERGLLTFGWGRWQEILQHSQLRKGWREQDVEDCARVILLYCLRFYRGDEKIRSFIWDLIAPSENGEQKISRNHQGLKDPVPRGIRNKNKNKKGENSKGMAAGKDSRHPAITDPNHWSKNEKYDGDIFLENNYKKHLGRHANKVLLRVRMLYYIKHEIIGDLVQHIADGVHASALPICPPATEQLPSPWWDADCDKSLLVGSWKHGYENYTSMRADPALCFLSRCGPPSDRDLQMATSNTQPPTPTAAPNDDDIEDEDTNEESSLKSKNRDASEVNSEAAEPSPGPSASSETPLLETEEKGSEEATDDKSAWPTITDLNTRLRRVITSYQRSYRKEEQKMAATAKAKPPIESSLSAPLAALAQVSQQFDPRDAAALGLQGWDLQQLALYLLKMERQGKQSMDQQASREAPKEKPTISRKWTKREEADFFRVASSYGVIYYRKKKSYDWAKFKQLAKLDKKTDDELTDYYKHFVVMCKKQTGLNAADESSYDATIEHIPEEKARRTLERLELLSRIREEILTHPKLDERLKVCVTSADMPDWWIAGKHDKDLLVGVAKHGLGRTDYYLLNDPELSFQEILRKKIRSEYLDSKEAIKLESREDILKFDKDEILVKLEKGEGTLKIEKVAPKKDLTQEKKQDESKDKNSSTEVKSETSSGDNLPETENLADSEEKTNSENRTEEEEESLTISKDDVSEKERPVEETDGKVDDKKAEEKEDTVSVDETVEREEKEENRTDEEPSKPVAVENVSEAEKEVKEAKDQESAAERKEEEEEEEEILSESDKKQLQCDLDAEYCSKQAAELKAMFPDLEVIQPLSRLPQSDAFVLRGAKQTGGPGALDFSGGCPDGAAKWPKEYAVQVRLQHIIYAVETKEWPAPGTFSAYATGIGGEFDVPIHELPNEPAKRETSTPAPLGDGDVAAASGQRKRKRHIAIDVETERAKLHALLNSSHPSNPLAKHATAWENDDPEESRRSTPVQLSALQPPPAHQHAARMSMGGMKMAYDPYHGQSAKTIGQTTVIPGTSSTLTPIDLSSSIPKMSEKSSIVDLHNEAQDFSVKKGSRSGNKLDDTLSKLMKRKNCPEPEQLVGKEKKRRKLDEIVLGLSAAKEQSLFPEPAKKPTVTPSVTVTPASAPPVSSSHNPSQKPFTITVTSVPSSAPPSSRSNPVPNVLSSLSGAAKDGFSSFLAQAEQQNLLLKKQQQQQRKSYEAMIADIGKASDFGSKANSYSHEAKVNKWLAEQNAALAEQPLGADYLSPRRRRPRVDPTLLDWKKLTGDENVAVIHRATGKKLTGPKAPTLKRLGQWLMENPVYDIDPKWADLVKERGNLSHDLHKRLSGSSGKSGKSGAPGRPPLLASPTGSVSSVGSMPSGMSFPSLSGSSLAGLNSNLLTGLSGLGQFDPKNPLLMPFAGLPNMGALGSMGGLGNLTNMNIFANLAGLGIPGLGGMDAAALSGSAGDSNKASGPGKAQAQGSSKSQKQPQEAHNPGKNQSSSGSIQTTSSFPFFFPNPGLLYTPLGLGGLNPFGMQPGMSAAYDTLAQQCSLLNGNMNPAVSPSSSGKPSKSGGSRSSTASTTTASAGHGKPRSSSRDAHLQQLLLPPDTQILESISKAAASYDAPPSKQSKSDKKEDKRKALESLRGMLPTDFSTTVKDKKVVGLPGLADFTKLLEAQVGQSAAKKTQEQQMKEAFEQFSKTNAELMAKALAEEQAKFMSGKRPRESLAEPAGKSVVEEENHQAAKKTKDAREIGAAGCLAVSVASEQEGVDIETLLPPSTVVKSAGLSPDGEKSPEPIGEVSPEQDVESLANKVADEPTKGEKQEAADECDSPPKKSAKRTRGKRRSGEMPMDHESVIAKKNLRSSASRSAAAAAARQKLEAENAQRESENNMA